MLVLLDHLENRIRGGPVGCLLEEALPGFEKPSLMSDLSLLIPVQSCADFILDFIQAREVVLFSRYCLCSAARPAKDLKLGAQSCVEMVTYLLGAGAVLALILTQFIYSNINPQFK